MCNVPVAWIATQTQHPPHLCGASPPLTIAIGINAGVLLPGKLSGKKQVNAVSGVAKFSDLSIDQLGDGYTLAVSASGLPGAESARFNITLL